MNYIDIIVSIILLFAIIDGWRRGAILQACSILGVLLGVWLASRFGESVGVLLHISQEWAALGGFLIILVASIVLMAILSRVLRGLFKFAGLGIVDVLLGGVLSLVKFAVILSLLFGAFDALNSQFEIVKKEMLAQSKLYNPIKNFTSKIFPALDWTQKQISSGLEKLQ